MENGLGMRSGGGRRPTRTRDVRGSVRMKGGKVWSEYLPVIGWKNDACTWIQQRSQEMFLTFQVPICWFKHILFKRKGWGVAIQRDDSHMLSHLKV
jgi:hypothetical protein